MKTSLYQAVSNFRKKYPINISWRVKQHARVVEMNINSNEKVLYTFCGQMNNKWYDIFYTCVVCLTNKRILIGQKKLFWGYLYKSITPAMFNDLSMRSRLIFGEVILDTLKEVIVISNLDKKSLPEIETQITTYMLEAKKLYNKTSDKS